jgi:transposase-like protein
VAIRGFLVNRDLMTSMAIDEKELEKLLNSINFKNLIPKQIMGENGLLKLFNKKIIERAMGSDMDQHLGYVKHEPAAANQEGKILY